MSHEMNQYAHDSSVLQELREERARINQTLGQFQLTFDVEVARNENILRGVEYDENGAEIKLYPELMNAIGRSMAMVKLRTWLSKIFAQSNFKEDRILRWCHTQYNTMVAENYSYGDHWGMDSDFYSSYVNNMSMQLEAMMRGALDAGLREAVGKVTSSKETSYVNLPADNKKAVL